MLGCLLPLLFSALVALEGGRCAPEVEADVRGEVWSAEETDCVGPKDGWCKGVAAD